MSFHRGETVLEDLATGWSKLSEAGWSNVIRVTRLCIATIRMGTFKKDTLEVPAPMQKTLAKEMGFFQCKRYCRAGCFFRRTICMTTNAKDIVMAF